MFEEIITIKEDNKIKSYIINDKYKVIITFIYLDSSSSDLTYVFFNNNSSTITFHQLADYIRYNAVELNFLNVEKFYSRITNSIKSGNFRGSLKDFCILKKIIRDEKGNN